MTVRRCIIIIPIIAFTSKYTNPDFWTEQMFRKFRTGHLQTSALELELELELELILQMSLFSVP